MASRYDLFKQAEEAQALVAEVATTEKLNDIDKDKKIEELQKQCNDLNMQLEELKKPPVVEKTEAVVKESSATVKESSVEQLEDDFQLGEPDGRGMSKSGSGNPLHDYLREKYQ